MAKVVVFIRQGDDDAGAAGDAVFYMGEDGAEADFAEGFGLGIRRL
jgi:hypothetical protein